MAAKREPTFNERMRTARAKSARHRMKPRVYWFSRTRWWVVRHLMPWRRIKPTYNEDRPPGMPGNPR